MLMTERYYVQRLTEHIFVVRERQSQEGGPGPNDRIVRSFDFRQDAYMYVDSVNGMQKTLDEQHGQWTQDASNVLAQKRT